MERKNGGTRWSEISAHDFFFFFSIDALMRAYRFNEPRKKVKSFGASMQIILEEDYAKSRPAL